MKIYVIHNPLDLARAENIKTQFAGQEGDWEYEIVKAVMNPSQPSVGTCRSFKKCIELAKKARYPEVLILEDDFLPLCSTALTDLIKIWNNQALNDGILLGGIYEGNTTFIVGDEKPYRNVFDKVSGLQACIIPKNLYEIILQAPEGYHLDYFLSTGHTTGFFPNRLPIYVVYPLSIVQGSFESANKNNMIELNRTLGLKYKLVGQ